MNTIKTIPALSLGALLLAGALPAGAVEMEATYTGKVTSGMDQTGVMFAPGTSLVGMSYSVTIYYNPDVNEQRTTVPGVSDLATGGAIAGGQLGTNSPIEDAELTIGGVTKFLPGQGSDGEVSAQLSEFSQNFDAAIEDRQHRLTQNLDMLTKVAGLPWSLDTFLPVLGVQGQGVFEFSNYDYTSSLQTDYIFAGFDVESMSITPPNDGFPGGPIGGGGPGGVPEPASWALMITGFLGAGAGLRARRQRLTTA